MVEKHINYGSIDRINRVGEPSTYDASQQVQQVHNLSLPVNLEERVQAARQGRAYPVLTPDDPRPAPSRPTDGELSHSYSVNTITSIRPEYGLSERFYAGERSGGKMSNIRRFFCLFITFDLLFTSLMWVICIMLRGENIMDALSEQVYHYSIHTSLFDVVLAAISRFTVLLLFYAFLYINHWIIISLTTSATCAFLIAKVFVYNWTDSSQPVFEVLLVLTSFVIAWAEAWFLDFKVIPQEQYAEQFFISPLAASERSPLVQNYVQSLPSAYTESVGNFYSPLNSPEPSVQKLEVQQRKPCPVAIPSFTREQEDSYKLEAREIIKSAWQTLNSTQWKLEKHNDKGDNVYVAGGGKSGKKMYKLLGIVNAPARYLLEELFYNVEVMPNWNPSVLHSHRVKIVDEYTDITYQVSANAGGGMISSRDFVTLRHWGIKEGCYVIANKGIDCPSIPARENYVRGKNGLGCWALGRVPENPNKTIFQWVLNTDIKGWIPTYVLEPAFYTMMFDYMKYLRIHVKKLKDHGFYSKPLKLFSLSSTNFSA